MSSTSISIERRVLAYEPAARLLLAAGVVCSFGATLLLLGQALVLSEIVARVFITGDGVAGVTLLLVVIVALAAGRAVLTFIGDMLAQTAANRLKTRLRHDLTGHLLSLGPAFTDHERSGELVHTAVQGVEDLDEYVAVYQPVRWLAALVPLAVLATVLLLDPFTVVILLLTGPVLVLLLALIGSRARDATERRFREMSWTSAHLLDMLQGLPTLKLFGRSQEQAEAVREISRRHGDLTMQVLRTAFETSFVLEMCSALAVALVAVEVSLRLVEGALPFERALALLVITPEFFLPLRQLSAHYHAGATGRAAAERIFALLETGSSVQGPAFSALELPLRRRGGGWGKGLPAFDGDIRFEHVSFAYDGRVPALSDVSLTIPRGSTLALVGETGAGKTTLARLFLGFLEPRSGSITVGDQALDPGVVGAWLRQIAWVPQRPHLFHGTVAENIRLGRPGATPAEVEAAARAAGAHDFIAKLPSGYDTQIGERGSRLSGGEQQRLVIARAFLKDAPVLVIDEATSHLDSGTEARIEAALRRLLQGRTALIIAHRKRLARLAGRVAVLDHGRVVRTGTPEQVLGREPALEPSPVGAEALP